MSPIVEFAKECTFSEPTVDYVDAENILSFAQRVHQIDLRRCTLADVHDIRLQCKLRSLGTAVLSGVVGWFDVTFPGGIVLTTSPEEPAGYHTHWRQTQLLLNEGRQVWQDDEVDVTLHMRKSTKNHRFVEYHMELSVNGQPLPAQDYLLA